MLAKSTSRIVPLWTLAAVALVGCAQGERDDVGSDGPDPSKKVSVSGVVTVDGKPLPKVVVTFLPPTGGTGVGETDANGKYTLESYGSKGILPGEYKVAVSYLVSAEGEPQGLGPRSAIDQPLGMLTASEHLPAEYSDLGRTTLRANVSEAGGAFNFDVKGMTPVEPAPGKDAAAKSPAPAAAEPAKPEAEQPKADKPAAEKAKADKPAAEKPEASSPTPEAGAAAGPAGKK